MGAGRPPLDDANSARNARPHPGINFGRDAIVADDRPRVAQATGLALDDKAPQRLAGLLHQLFAVHVSGGLCGIVFSQRG